MSIKMPKIPSVIWVATITIVTMALDYLIQYFSSNGQGASFEYAPIISIIAFALLKVIEVYRVTTPPDARFSIRFANHSSKIRRIIFGD